MNKNYIVTIVSIIVLWIGGCGHSTSDDNTETRIFVLHSYALDYPWTHAIHDGIMTILGDKKCTIETFFMDTQKHPEKSDKIKAGLQALDKIKRFHPQVVIASDDDSQEFVGKFLVNKKHVSVVFCGVNENPSKYNYPGTNVTGIVEHPFIRNSLDLMKKIVPGVKSYTVLTDNSLTSKGFVQYLDELRLPIRIDKKVLTDDFNRWKHEIRTLRSDALITYIYYSIKDRGKLVAPSMVLKWTVENLTKPSVGFADFIIEGGILIGNVESGFEHGELAARKTLDIVNGKKAEEIPVSTAHNGLILVNAKTANRLFINISPIEKIADKVFR